jgi:hypothetical protein
LEELFTSFLANRLLLAIPETFWASVVETAVVLENKPLFVVVSVIWGGLFSTFLRISQKPSLAPMPAHYVVDVDAPLLLFSLQPQQRLS